MSKWNSIVEKMLKIRFFESELLDLFSSGKITGTTHTYSGQEAIASIVSHFIEENDFIISNHRSHGHFLALTQDYHGLLNEILGNVSGVCSGIGGSQHLYSKQFLSNGILGSLVPVGVGIALAKKINKKNNLVIIFIGDGVFGQGVLYESLNMSKILNVPVLFIIENNDIAQSTPSIKNLSGSIQKRFESFDIPCIRSSDQNLTTLFEIIDESILDVRKFQTPKAIEISTQRLNAHSKGDDTRSENQIDLLNKQDPLRNIDVISQNEFNELKNDSQIFIKKLFNQEKDSILPKPKKNNESQQNIRNLNIISEPELDKQLNRGIRGVEYLNKLLLNLLESNSMIMVLGEDISDPYGGAFKVTQGLSTKFETRIISTPISEASLVGVGIGLSISGNIAIIEIMFGDFITLILDQIINNASKFKYMYDQQVLCPLIIRTPMGGYRGYGPTHSQSLEKLFFSVKGVHVVSYSNLINQYNVWNNMLKLGDPVLYVENKSLYSKPIKRIKDNKIDDFYARYSFEHFEILELQIENLDILPEVSIFVYGGMVEETLSAAKEFYLETETIVRIIVFTRIYPLDLPQLEYALKTSSKILIVEESFENNGWASYLSFTAKNLVNYTGIIRFVAARGDVIPNSTELELEVLPNKKNIVEELKKFYDPSI
jgi:2-oxoisovalerate dehydrogenase E1 component